MRGTKGFTLIEMAVVLAIIAVLAAIMTPIVTGYIDQARITRANADVASIKDAILLYKRDTGVYPGYSSLALARAGGTLDSAADCLLSGTSTTFSGTGWTCTTNGTLNNFLNVQSLGLSSGNAVGGLVAYRGPYLDGLNGNDPWGNQYVVNSKFLAGTGANSTSWAFAISAGPDGTLSTTQNQSKTTTALAVGGDDIVSLIK